ncbi:MAG: mevalonate kinase family protein [Promethearchaeota archaeon]
MKIIAPGRICLFGEHQDYLGFPIISAAINRYIFLEDKILEQKIKDSAHFHIKMLDISKTLNLIVKTSERLKYQSKRDYLKSGVNVILDFIKKLKYNLNTNCSEKNQPKIPDEFFYPREITIKGNIPINAGASSSSAMVIAWVFYLSKILKLNISKEEIANLGYLAEVKEFSEAGGMMDHFTSSLGGMIYMETAPIFKPYPISNYKKNFDKSFILINSKQKKNTVEDLRRVKTNALRGFEVIKQLFPKFDKYNTKISEVKKYKSEIDDLSYRIAIGNLENRDITQQARKILLSSEKKQLDDKEKRIFGNLIYRHHRILTEKIGISTPKIDELIEFCMDNGAYGGKINGSGFGGTFFIYCPENRDEIFEKLKKLNLEAYKVEIANGVEVVNQTS